MKRTVPVALMVVAFVLAFSNPVAAHPRKHHNNWHQLTDGQKKRHVAKIQKKKWQVRHNDFHKALKFAAHFWGVSYHWLHACAHGEGGHGPRMIWNTSGSSAYGPMQYMPGTYLGFASKSFRAGKARGLKLKWKWFYNTSYPQGRPDTLFGQAFSAAWAFRNGLSSHWAAYAC